MKTMARTRSNSGGSDRANLRLSGLLAVMAVSGMALVGSAGAVGPDLEGLEADAGVAGQSAGASWSVLPPAASGTLIPGRLKAKPEVKQQGEFVGFGQTVRMVREVWRMLSHTSPAAHDKVKETSSAGWVLYPAHRPVRASANGIGGWCIDSEADGRCALLMHSMSEAFRRKKNSHQKPCPRAKRDLNAGLVSPAQSKG